MASWRTLKVSLHEWVLEQLFTYIVLLCFRCLEGWHYELQESRTTRQRRQGQGKSKGRYGGIGHPGREGGATIDG